MAGNDGENDVRVDRGAGHLPKDSASKGRSFVQDGASLRK